ncbi:hypothetical protein QR78_16775 [Methylobacterium indicum]|uniref:Integrase catalytic domain-containing protein n=1 Tax=Methylobacterium indicum TaxID=1775910 RepID=A0ABR5H9U5_9HYPH|nr:hypothetical protein QR78_16775 [Methylobacterium indicum]KMO21632.1 hypothetical protein QR79_16670 [Methylobacterium indicum]
MRAIRGGILLNGMTKALARTLKRACVRVFPISVTEAILRQLHARLDHDNRVHRYSALGYRSPCELIARSIHEPWSSLQR